MPPRTHRRTVTLLLVMTGLALLAALFAALPTRSDRPGPGNGPDATPTDRVATPLFASGDAHATGDAPPRSSGAPAPGAEPGAPSDGVLTGRVLDEDGRPVSGAEVAASIDGRGQPVRTRSDAEGAFRLADLDPAARWLVGARAPDRAPAFIGGCRPDDPPLELRLHPPLALDGRIVRDRDETPCPGARVGLALTVPGIEQPLVALEVRADEEGRFRFEGLPDLHGRLTGEWKGHPAEAVRVYPGTPATEPLLLRVHEGLALAGRVVDRDGTPLEGITVAASIGRTGHGSTPTDAEGRWRLAGLGDGEYRVTAVDWDERVFEDGLREGVRPPRGDVDFTLARDAAAPGRVRFRLVRDGAPVVVGRGILIDAATGIARGTGDLRPDAQGVLQRRSVPPGRWVLLVRSGGDWVREGPFTVTAGQRLDLGTLALRPGVRLVGRLLGADGSPLAGAALFAPPSRLQESRESGPDGRFEVAGVPGGDGRLRIEAAGHEVRRIPWQAADGATVDLGDLRLRAATGVIEGRVVFPDGTVPEGALVRIERLEDDGTAYSRFLVEVAPDGQFRFDRLPAGEWSTALLLRRSPDDVHATGRAGPAVPLAEGERRTVEIAWR